MKILEHLNNCSAPLNIKYIVIGGHAVNAYGYSRHTADLDILVRKLDREFWVSTILAGGFKANQQHEFFCRFIATSHINWPLDLMLVDDNVFQELWQESRLEDFNGVEARIPHVKHLIALKLHALKQHQSHREDKDFLDIKSILQYNKGIIDDLGLKNLCTKYSRLDLYEKLKQYI